MPIYSKILTSLTVRREYSENVIIKSMMYLSPQDGTKRDENGPEYLNHAKGNYYFLY